MVSFPGNRIQAGSGIIYQYSCEEVKNTCLMVHMGNLTILMKKPSSLPIPYYVTDALQISGNSLHIWIKRKKVRKGRNTMAWNHTMGK